MSRWLVGAILLGSAVAGTLSEFILFRMFHPPDVTSAILAALWVAMPYLAAVGIAALRRKRIGALIGLLIALLIAGAIGVSLLDASATQQGIAEQEARDAVQPGEDPNAGPGGMRKAAAEVGVALGGAFAILLVLVLPPIQLVAVLIATVIGYGVGALLRRRDRNVKVS